jgi:N-glycosylase/DNA lyase
VRYSPGHELKLPATFMPYLNKLLLEYKKRKTQIKQRLNDFKDIHKSNDNNIFSELCFCLLTPQSKAIYCDKAVKELKKSGLLFKGRSNSIRKYLSKVRFPNNKAKFIVEARHVLKNGSALDIKSKFSLNNIFNIREWLVKNIKGLGYKEASHFLRNIGLGRNLAILDVHILKNLKEFGIIKNVPKSITKNNYIKIENKVRDFSKTIKIPMEELDLLFWAKETGYIFK